MLCAKGAKHKFLGRSHTVVTPWKERMKNTCASLDWGLCSGMFVTPYTSATATSANDTNLIPLTIFY